MMTSLIDFFKTLSDETRLRILVLLFTKELCVCELCEILNESQPKVSRHLAKLRDIGLVEDERKGQWIFYHLSTRNELVTQIIQKVVESRTMYQILLEDEKRLEKKLSEKRMCDRLV